MTAVEDLKVLVVKAMKEIWNQELSVDTILINGTRSEFEGDYTLVVFPFTKSLKLPPQNIAETLGKYLINNSEILDKFNVVKGFLNLSFSEAYWKDVLYHIIENENHGYSDKKDKKVLVEFSSPNTNKPLHLGHIRNILLGWSSAELLNAAGYDVIKTQIVNDRGIAICKSMLAYKLFGDQKSPEESNKKGDHLIGEFYVAFESEFKKEYLSWQESEAGIMEYEKGAKENEAKEHFFARYKNDYFNNFSELGKGAKELLIKWEDGDQETIALWKKLNSWVYKGFEETYTNLGVDFDCYYYESDTYKLGKELINQGLKDNVFYQKDDGSVWVNLEDVGMDQKLVLRSDGTSVYMTQDIGTAQIRNKDHNVNRMVYVVADEQDYHFKALFEILKKLKEPYAGDLHHLSYGMVDLPTGKMKSREGTVVDADDLIRDVIQEAKKSSNERGEMEGVTIDDQNEIFRKIGLAALKYFIIKVNPRKRMTFDPKESVDMQGQTGPYIQNAYVRTRSLLRKSENVGAQNEEYKGLKTIEKDIIIAMGQFSSLIQDAAENLDPSTIANYCYNLAKSYHRFWHELRILTAESEDAKIFRLKLSIALGKTLKTGMHLLGIEMPERM